MESKRIFLLLALFLSAVSFAEPTIEELQNFADSFVSEDLELIEDGLKATPELAKGVLGPYNESMLHIAVKQRLLKVAALLIKYGADVNACMLRGVTPIFLAVEQGSPEMIRLLLRHRTDLTHQTDLGETARSFCFRERPSLLPLFDAPSELRTFEAAQMAAAIGARPELPRAGLSVSGMDAADFVSPH